MSVNSFLIGLLGTATFASGLRASGAHRASCPAAEKVRRVLQHLGCHPCEVVSTATPAHNVLHDLLSRQTKQAAKRKLFKKLKHSLVNLAVKANQAWIPKQQVTRNLFFSAPLVGQFTASRIWQIQRAHMQCPRKLDFSTASQDLEPERASIGCLVTRPPSTRSTLTQLRPCSSLRCSSAFCPLPSDVISTRRC